MNEPRVFVIQHPQRKGVPLDISDAGRMGIIQKPILPPMYNAQIDTADVTRKIEAGLNDVDPDDYILCIGDPVLIAIAGIIAARNTGGEISMLKWNRALDKSGNRQRTVGHYVPCEILIDV